MYREVISPVLGRLDSETLHTTARKALGMLDHFPPTQALLELFSYEDGNASYEDRLQVHLAQRIWRNPVMVGAGWDKTGEAVGGLYRLGFSGVEVGTVVKNPQSGSPKPRQFVIGDGVAINRLGFNSPGMAVVKKRLSQISPAIPIGISIGKNKESPDSAAPDAHADVVRCLYDNAIYFAINVSSPNTPGLRRLQDKGPLTDIVQAVNGVMDDIGQRKPVFVKIAPDLPIRAVDDVVEVALDNGLAGIIAANTTIRADLKGKYGQRWAQEAGGLSGDDREFRSMVTKQVAHIYSQAGRELDIIGVGGVKDAETAWERIAAGAKMVQVVTAIRGEGPKVAANINLGLIRMMNQEGVRNIGEIVGIGAT